MKPNPHAPAPNCSRIRPAAARWEVSSTRSSLARPPLAARHAQLANEPLYAVAACAFGCGMCTLVALEAAKLSGHRWTSAAVAPAFAATVVAVDAVTASLLRVFPPPA